MKTFLFAGLLFGFAAPAWADHVNQGALHILDAGCRAAAGSNNNGYRCFQRAYSDLAAQERWGAARNSPDAPAF